MKAEVRLPAPRFAEGKPDTTDEGPRGVRVVTDGGLQPWQFFVLAGLGCASVVVYIARGQGVTAVILLSIVIAATSLVGFAVLRALRPLVSAEEDRTSMFGHRTRVALEREKMLALRSIKELEFDRAMGKLSESDWLEMSGRLRARAARLMRQLDAGAGYREQIERDLAKRLGEPVRPQNAAAYAASADTRVADADPSADTPICASCSTTNDPDARFCKSCGQKL